MLTTGSDELILVSHQGLAVRFRERDPETGEDLFRALSRNTGGVRVRDWNLASAEMRGVFSWLMSRLYT